MITHRTKQFILFTLLICTAQIIKPMAKPVLLVVAHRGYQPTEYHQTREALEQAGFQVIVASDQPGIAVGAPDDALVQSMAPVDLTLPQVNVDDFGGIFFIGGPQVLEHLDNQESYRIAQQAIMNNLPLGAISYTPRILANAGVLNRRFATGWDGDNQLSRIFYHAGARYVTPLATPVVVDGLLVTSEGRNTAAEFGAVAAQIMRTKIMADLKNIVQYAYDLNRTLEQIYYNVLAEAAQYNYPSTRISRGVRAYWPRVYRQHR